MKISNQTIACLGSLLLAGLLFGCATQNPPVDSVLSRSTVAYKYQPLRPTTIWFGALTCADRESGMNDPDWQSAKFKSAVLRDLDTETVRISLDQISASSELSAGVVGTSVAGQSYLLIVDYIKYNSSNREVDLDYPIVEDGNETTKQFKGTIPIYAGIGLRIRAEFTAHESGLNISGLPAISVAATTEGISGRLTVSTLGITGREISPLMPIISDISVTSIQNAVQAVGAIKAKIYEDDTVIALKIIGYESPNTDPGLIQKLTEYLYGIDLTVYPAVSPNPEYPEDPDKKLYWVNWLLKPWDEQTQDTSCETSPAEAQTWNGNNGILRAVS